MLPSYKTVKGYGEKEIIIEKSRFIAYVDKAESEEEATAFIDKIKREHWNATHNCSAYIIGEHDQHQKANDDGEPSGTAGIPMLEVLKKRGLKDTVVVVTRYFGGIKLGAGGLIRAYTQSTVAGLEAATIVERKLQQEVTVQIEYTLLGKVENELRQHTDWIIEKIDYQENVIFYVLVPEPDIKNFEEIIIELTSSQCSVVLHDKRYVEQPLT